MHIVVVESTVIGRKILKKYFEGQRYPVNCFSDAEEALKYIKENNSVKLVLTSMETEGMEGCEFVWKCRLLEKDARRIHIIVMSSQKESGGAVEALDSGADDYIRKPLVRDELYARIRSAARLLAYQKDLSFYAARDSLTGLLNRHTFTKKVKSILEDPFTVPVCSFLLVDIDHFKSVNDTYGHPAGDRVIKEIAQLLDGHGQLVGRVGGEEFAILFQGNLGKAMDFAESIRLQVENHAMEVGPKKIRATISIGLTEVATDENRILELVYARADDALYSAKRNGRNQFRVSMASLTSPSGRANKSPAGTVKFG